MTDDRRPTSNDLLLIGFCTCYSTVVTPHIDCVMLSAVLPCQLCAYTYFDSSTPRY